MTTLLRLIGRRLVAFPIMVLGVTFLVFFVMSFSPADPARLALGESASLEALEAYREEHGLNDPMLVRYVRFLGGMLHGDLGTSAGNVPVTEFVAKAFPITLQLTLIGLLIAAVVAVVLGIVAALYRDRWPDQIIRVLSIASLATPSFWLAILLIQWLGNVPGGAGIFPAVVAQWVGFAQNPGAWANNIALPAIAFADGDAPNFGNCAPTGEAGSISLTTVEPDTLIVATVLTLLALPAMYAAAFRIRKDTT